MRTFRPASLATFFASLVLAAQLGCATGVPRASLADREPAADFSLPKLPRSKNFYELSSYAGQNTYFDFMHETITPELKRLASEEEGRLSNEDGLAQGQGIGVKLDETNYNFHINFPAGDQGGRSYGWTGGKVGDWSDKMYLQELGKVMTADKSAELGRFYTTIIQLLGASNAEGIKSLEGDTQRVANNFLAIYTAEQYRAMVGSSKWDDALLQVTMLGAFHGGQETFTKYYLGTFSEESFKQAPGVYKGKVEGVSKPADFTDYWQFSAREDSKRSGINLTRGDFERLGKSITSYYTEVAKRSPLGAVQAIVGESPNVIKAISQHFTEGKADVTQADALAAAVSKFLVRVNKDAPKITEWIAEQEQ
jgi:hypothetical protein